MDCAGQVKEMNGTIAFICVPAAQLNYQASVSALTSAALEVLMEGAFCAVEEVDHKNYMWQPVGKLGYCRGPE